ncbi:phage replisome organizer N-terminal domain-containing protein, partial [Campylobacter jejuni]
MAGKERNMKDEEYCVRFPLDFFDDARVKVIEAMPSGDTIICLWIRFLFLRVRAMDM